MTENAFDLIRNFRLVPVVAIDDADKAGHLADALVVGGLPCAEITFRTDAAASAIERAARVSGMLVGAGTVLTVDQAKQAVDAGARFIVSPGIARPVVEWCVAHAVPVAPGVMTPTELQEALVYGLETIKFFPAEVAGGLPMLKALAAPFPQATFIPTGGIHAGNLRSYLALESVLACGGSWMVKRDLVADGEFDEIARITAEAVTIVRET